MDGITGNILFENGKRIDCSFEIIELTNAGITKVGSWSKETNITFHRYSSAPLFLGDDELSLVNKTFTVLLSKVSFQSFLYSDSYSIS